MMTPDDTEVVANTAVRFRLKADKYIMEFEKNVGQSSFHDEPHAWIRIHDEENNIWFFTIEMSQNEYLRNK